MRIRTGHSYHLATGKLEEVKQRLCEIGYTVFPISDRMSTFAFTTWNTLVKGTGMPVFGVELAVTRSFKDKKPINDYWSFFAIDELSSINSLVYQATANPVGNTEPALSYPQALNAPGTITIAGEKLQMDLLPENLPDNFYLGLSPSLSKGLLKEAVARGIPLIATGDNYYTRERDLEFYRVVIAARANTQTYPRHILSDKEWMESVRHIATDSQIADALKNRDAALDMCKAKLLEAELFKPDAVMPLRQMCEIGANKKGIDLCNPHYAGRLNRELKLIAEKKFDDYFFIIADLIQYAKQHMVVGPARGSSCGSLVCYLLDITAIDPLKFDLIFERFIDTSRADLPDIDIDFSDEKRHLVFEYADKKYGHGHVARLGTANTFKPRSAMRSIGAALNIPQWKLNKVLENLIVRNAGDARADQTLEDTLTDTDEGRALHKEFPLVSVAAKMEGHPSNASQHAAGLIITRKPVLDHVAIDARTNAAMCDKYDAEKLNLLKIDALGLTQLSIFERAAALIGIKNPLQFLERLPLDAPEAFDVLNKGHFSGIFQFMGPALKNLTKRITVSTIEDIISLTALARPGPMGSGGANVWVKRKNGHEPIQYPHPLFEPILKDTLGIVIYQEQVMRIGREIGDMTWEEVTAVRKAMSKSLGKEILGSYGEDWKEGAAKKGIAPAVLDKVWNDLCEYGQYGFNRSHAVAYGIVSYWCCWLKAHHPLEFAAASLDAEPDSENQLAMLKELEEEGVKYIPIDKQHSGSHWGIRNGHLVGPLTLIKGIGPAKLRKIEDYRESGVPLDPGIVKLLDNPVTGIDTLTPIRDAIDRLHPDLKAIKIESKPTPLKAIQTGDEEEFMVFGVVTSIKKRHENDEEKIAKRGFKRVNGPMESLHMFIRDDTDELFCMVERWNFEKIGQKIFNGAKPGKSLYAFKGYCPRTFRMVVITKAKYLGEMG